MTLEDVPNQPSREVIPRWKRKAARRTARDKQQARRADWTVIRQMASERAHGKCEAGVRGVCVIQGSHAHHVILRSQGGPDELWNVLWLCHQCHRWCHDHPEKAMENGWIRPGV